MPIDFLFPPPEPVNWALLMIAVAIQAATLSLLWRLERGSARESPQGGQRRLHVLVGVLSGFSLLALLLEVRFSLPHTVSGAAVFTWMVVLVGAIGWYYLTDSIARDRIFTGAIKWAILGTVAVFAIDSFALSLGFMNPRPLLETPIGDARISDLRFSPDGLTLAVSRRERETDIVRVSDGTLLQKLPGGGLRCAWNSDGSLLAVARSHWPDIELWDSRTWTLQKRLSLYDPEKGRPKSEAPYGLMCFSMCFDRWNNLYIAEESSYDSEVQQPDAFPDVIPQKAVFWRACDALSEIRAHRLFSVASVGNAARLACSDFGYGSPGVEVWSVQTPTIGPGLIQQKYAVPQLRNGGWVSLSADGKYLVVRSDENFLLLELFDDHAEVIRAKEMKGDSAIWPTTDIAANGSAAALTGRDRVTVLEIPSGRTLLEIKGPLITSRRSPSIALSPDGRLLATTDWDRRSVRIYQVPE
jgi:WD40 repeat protein